MLEILEHLRYMSGLSFFIDLQGAKIFQYSICPGGRVIYNFHSSCKQMHLSFKKVSNKEHKGSNMLYDFLE